MPQTKKERTLVIIKPDGVQRGLIGEIINRLERTGLKFIAFKMLVPSEEQCWAHYHKDDNWFEAKGANTIKNREASGSPIEKPAIEYGKDIVRALVKFMTSGPVIAMVLEGNQSIGVVKKIVGSTEPLTSDVGTIRGDFTTDSYDFAVAEDRAVRNLIHCTDKPEDADGEINNWFKEEELMRYKQFQERVLNDVNFDGVLE